MSDIETIKREVFRGLAEKLRGLVAMTPGELADALDPPQPATDERYDRAADIVATGPVTEQPRCGRCLTSATHYNGEGEDAIYRCPVCAKSDDQHTWTLIGQPAPEFKVGDRVWANGQGSLTFITGAVGTVEDVRGKGVYFVRFVPEFKPKGGGIAGVDATCLDAKSLTLLPNKPPCAAPEGEEWDRYGDVKVGERYLVNWNHLAPAEANERAAERAKFDTETVDSMREEPQFFRWITRPLARKPREAVVWIATHDGKLGFATITDMSGWNGWVRGRWVEDAQGEGGKNNA